MQDRYGALRCTRVCPVLLDGRRLSPLITMPDCAVFSTVYVRSCYARIKSKSRSLLSERFVRMVRAELLRTMARAKAVAQQLQSQVWNHDNNLFDYQVWSVCRVATKQLNTLHAERPTAKAAEQSEVSRLDRNFAARLLGLLFEGARVLGQFV